MYLKLSLYKNQIFIILLFLFSIIINQFYGNRGVLPMDSFFHFDSSYRILNGENPFSDFWVVSGPIVDYIQTIFFYIFGTNWNSYVLHASLMNAALTLSTFFLLKKFKLNTNLCFLYSLLISILAYPSSGTPFVDHHSAFFSLFAIYIFLFAIKNNKNIYWIFLPIFLGLGFFSKQVPSLYVAFFVAIALLLYFINNKNNESLKFFVIGVLLFVFTTIIFGIYNDIQLKLFIDQYILYPLSIGSGRFENLNLNFQGVVAHFKFIYLAAAVLFYINIRKFFIKKKYFNTVEFYTFFILISFTISLIWHQLLTKNQTFIFFLIPILTAFSHISLNEFNLKPKKIINIFLILFCIFVTAKYHLRFNEGRKFHEFRNTNFNLAIDAQDINKKLSGLKWITPEYSKNPKEEINLINKITSHLEKDTRNKMVMTNYLFLSAVLEQKIFSPFRMYAGDGTSFPIEKGRHFDNYKQLIINKIKKNDISVVYIVHPLNNKNIYNYIDKNCFNEFTVFEYLKGYEIKPCKEINS